MHHSSMNASIRGLWELKNERNKAVVRWLLILLVSVYLAWLLEKQQGIEIGARHLFNWYYVGALSGAAAILNLVFSIYIARRKKSGVHPALKYISMGLDFAIISLMLIPTGGDKSIFFLLYFIVIISNSLRYGMRLALTGLLVFTIMYFSVLAWQYPQRLVLNNAGIPLMADGFQIQAEALKLAVFWLVGIYCGYMARRYENLQGEVEKYQRLVQRLMQQEDTNVLGNG
ncbi:MAG: hypothetical protein KDK39_01445 [Leptospiraceae bacterium]|nr:hypothetical protein [Leptospiraceae bacterium]